MLACAANVVLGCETKDNGRTLYEDHTGHRVKHHVAGFGEHLLFQVAKDESNRNTFDGQLMQGMVVGVAARSYKYIVSREGCVFRCLTVRIKHACASFPEGCMSRSNVDHHGYVMNGGTTHRVNTYAGGICL